MVGGHAGGWRGGRNVSAFFFILTLARAVERRPKMGCTWDQCPQMCAESELKIHLRNHGNNALHQFQPPSTCIWPGCSSKAVFQSKTNYSHHLDNIHVEPLICTAPNCSYKKPFRNQDDLDRHSSTIHSDVKNYECPYPSCDSEIKKFARKGKWLKHIRETIHDNDAFCPYYHCTLGEAKSWPFKNRKQISTHFDIIHARNSEEAYECALGTCAENPFPANWSRYGLEKHLRDDHSLFSPMELNTVHNMGDGRIATTEHVPGYVLHICRDCSLCSKVQTA